MCTRLDAPDRPANAYTLSNSFDSMWPSKPSYEDSHQDYHAQSDETGLGERSVPRCTAALAVTYIRRRKNHSVSDRLAIMANICDYEFRLDTRKVKDFKSLAVAYLTQALTNGDFSLCIPELINTATQANGMNLPISRLASISEARRHWDSHWCPHPNSSLPFTDSRYTRPRSLLAIRNSMNYWIHDTGLRCPATIWQVEEKIDLRSVRDRWLSTWNDMKCVVIETHRSPQEANGWTYLEMNEMVEWARQHQTELTHDLIDIPDRYRPYISCKVPSSIEEDEHARERALCNLLIDILGTIARLGYFSLADSIWMSTRKDAMPKIPGKPDADNFVDLPDTVWELLYLRLDSKSEHIFQFDWKDAGSFYQAWIIDRVMSEGYLWYGEAQASTYGMWYDRTKHQQGAAVADTTVRPDRLADSTFMEREREKERLMQIYNATSLPGGDLRDDDFAMSSATRTTNEMKTANHKRAMRRHDLRGLLAAFDVDGPTTIAIPLDEELERLPHPPERTMSVCWKVDQLDTLKLDAGIREDFEATEEYGPIARFKVTGKVRGCWPQMEYVPCARYEFE
ncbi:hypothetical protein MBLNU230_g7846t1 [Neophaeotheca triangularis]